MSDLAFTIPSAFDYGATFLFATAGTILALRKGYDIIGTLTVACVSSVGGGLIRDGLFLQQGPPGFVTESMFLVMILFGATVAILFQKFFCRLQTAIAWVDALGLGAYAVVGMQKAMLAGLATPAVVLVGLINAVGGGILRDVLTREEPLIFRPGQFYAAAAFLGCLVFLGLQQVEDLTPTTRGIITILVTFAMRMMAIRYNWQTQQLGRPQELDEEEYPLQGLS